MEKKQVKPRRKRFSVSKLHRFNKNPNSRVENSKFLDHYFEVIKKTLELNKSGNLTEYKMVMTFPWRKDMAKKSISDLQEGLHVYSNLELELYYKLQEILIELNNGRPMRMDIFVNLIITWFIHTYYNKVEFMSEGDPFFIPKEIKLQNKKDRNKLINKFNIMFNKYYDTIIKLS